MKAKATISIVHTKLPPEDEQVLTHRRALNGRSVSVTLCLYSSQLMALRRPPSRHSPHCTLPSSPALLSVTLSSRQAPRLLLLPGPSRTPSPTCSFGLTALPRVSTGWRTHHLGSLSRSHLFKALSFITM